MIFTGVTGGEIVSMLYPLFILSPFCYIIISKESLDGASYVLYRKRSLWISEKRRSGISGVRSCRNDCFAFLYSNDRSEYFSFKSAYYVFRSDGR